LPDGRIAALGATSAFRCGLFWLLLVSILSACGPKIVPAPVVTTPKFPEFIHPIVPSEFANSPASGTFERGWAFLQTGDLKTAEREFSAALAASPGFAPAETSLGYIELARKDLRAALPHFERAIERQPRDIAPLLARAQALDALGRDADAIPAFEAALAVDPSLGDVRRRVEVLKFRGAEQNINRARQLARQGHADEALRAYETAIASSPESPFLYREVAAIERQKGSDDQAIAHFRKAVELDPGDARSIAQIGEILEKRGDDEGAAKEYAASLAIEPNADIERKIEAIRERAALAALPAEYKAIDQSPQITRADLAALIGIRLAPLLQGDRRGGTVVITDTRNSWAASWIMAVARAGIMDPFANHTFQPRTVVRRTELAVAVARLLTRIAAQHPSQAKSWESARLKFGDLSPTHLAYPAASAAVAAGVMKTGPDNNFQPNKPVTGAEALDAIANLEGLAGLTSAKSRNPQ
jgi:tetratricopeptide (TPR) repeat protein